MHFRAMMESLECRRLLSATVQLVKDINQTSDMLAANELAQVGNVVFFGGQPAAAEGRELWTTDGTGPGTQLVKDINPGVAGSDPRLITDVNGTAFFVATTAAEGAELWKSDGTSAGTMLVRDIRAGTAAASPSNLVNVNGTLYFTANDGTGTHVWQSDGTTAGTIKVPGGPNLGSTTVSMVNYNGTLMFHSSTQLYQVIGGTASVVSHSLTGVGPQNLTVFGGFVYFTGSGSGTINGNLYRTDGTSAGTTLVRTIDQGTSPDYARSGRLTVSGNLLYFISGNLVQGQYDLWRSDGSSGGTFSVTTGSSLALSNSVLVPINSNSVLFANTSAAAGTEPWISNGTTASLLRDVLPGTESSMGGFAGVRLANGRVLFTFTTAAGAVELWTTNGTTSGTNAVYMLPDTNGYALAYGALNGTALFTVGQDFSSGELYRSDGSVAGTVSINVPTAARGSGLTDRQSTQGNGTAFITVGSEIYFSANDGITGQELWRTDAAQGAVRVADIAVGGVASAPTDFVRTTNGYVVFTAFTPEHGRELYRMLPGSSPVRAPEVVSGPGSVGGRILSAVGESVYFTHYDATIGTQLYRYTPGTNALVAVRTTDNHFLRAVQNQPLVKLGSHWYFGAAAVSSGNTSITGVELFRVSEATTATAELVSDLVPGSSDSYAAPLGVVGTRLLFAATTPQHGNELFWTDGTAAGTVLYADLSPGSASTDIGTFHRVILSTGDAVYFSARTSSGSNELLYRAGATLGSVAPIATNGLRSPLSFATLNGDVFVGATDNAGGGVFKLADGAATRVMASAAGNNAYTVPALHATTTELFAVKFAGSPSNRWELWKTSSAGNEQFVTDLAPRIVGSTDPFVSFYSLGRFALTSRGDELFFPRYTPETGVELHKLRLPSTGSISGVVYYDQTINGTRDAGEPIVGNDLIYIDSNNNGVLDVGEPSTVHGPTGYRFEGLEAGVYRIRRTTEPGFRQTSPQGNGSAIVVSLAAQQNAAERDFGITDQGPNAHIGSTYFVIEGEDVMLDGSLSSEPLGTIVRHEWDLNYSPQTGFQADAVGVTTLFSALTLDGPHTQTIALRVTDAAGLTGLAVGAVEVLNLAPTATFTTGPAVLAGSPSKAWFSNVRDQSIEDGLHPFLYSFDFNNDGDFTDPGDIYNSLDPVGSIVFPGPGSYSIRAVVKDRHNMELRPFVRTLVVQADTGAKASGVVYHDLNANGQRDAGEPGLGGLTVYLDLDNDQIRDSNEQWTLTEADGSYLLGAIPPASSSARIRAIVPAGFSQVTPANGFGHAINSANGAVNTGRNFGLSGSAPDTTPPSVVSARYSPGTNTISVQFNEPMAAYNGTPVLDDRHTFQPFAVSTTTSYDALTYTRHWTLSDLREGQWRFSLLRFALTDLAGNQLPYHIPVDFHFFRGDMNNDGVINNLDIAPFVQGLTSPESFETTFGYSPQLLGDVNGDGAFNNLDIAPFVAMLTGGRSTALTPPPSSVPSRTPMRGSLFSDGNPLSLASDDAAADAGPFAATPTRAKALVG